MASSWDFALRKLQDHTCYSWAGKAMPAASESAQLRNVGHTRGCAHKCVWKPEINLRRHPWVLYTVFVVCLFA